VARFFLKHTQLDQLREKHGLIAIRDFARAIGIHETQVSRILRSNRPVGAKFVASVLHRFGTDLIDTLFDIRSEEER